MPAIFPSLLPGPWAQLSTDSTQRLLLACVLHDATDSLSLWDCDECCLRPVPCPRHQARAGEVWPRYLELAGRLAIGRPFVGLDLSSGDAQTLAQAARDALTQRYMRGTLNEALAAAYTILAERLAAGPVRR